MELTADPPKPEAAPAGRPVRLEDLLAEQQSLTAVETFCEAHDAGIVREERLYRSLIPATPPGPGEQYAFEVDLDACSGCKACVVACHSLNGLAEEEAWRDVGLLHGEDSGLPVLQHVTTACHHCVDPGCMKGCPTNAYEKDLETGIVRHLDDQCFGCQYCTLTCPYEVPKYHAGHGIVRKCDMCSSRLSAGESPACVQACPHEAIRIRTVSVEGAKAAAARESACGSFAYGQFGIPHAPPAQQTVPTTRYVSERLDVSSLEPADLKTPRPAHAHAPLTIMLALTQLGVGAFVFAAALWLAGVAATSTTMKLLTAAGFLVVNAGLAAATLHLGRPHLAFRAVLGWRHSWLSREAIAFGVFMPAAAAATALAWSDVALSYAGLSDWQGLATAAFGGAVMSAAGLGLVSVFTSVMIYVAARKPLWSLPRTAARFALTVAIGGAALALAAGQFDAAFGGRWPVFAALVLAAGAKLALDFAAMNAGGGDLSTPDGRTAHLLRGPLRPMVWTRLILTAGGLLCAAVVPVLGVPLLFAGELVERWLFFTAVTGPKMPGGMPA